MADVTFHPDAQREYQAAISWYQERNPAAARRFVAEIERVVGVIAAHPDRYGFYDDAHREAGLQRRFPFSIIYRVEASGDVTVIAVAHTSREPGYWQERA
jgi:plasmid stabilization system protein ParE